MGCTADTFPLQLFVSIALAHYSHKAECSNKNMYMPHIRLRGSRPSVRNKNNI